MTQRAQVRESDTQIFHAPPKTPMMDKGKPGKKGSGKKPAAGGLKGKGKITPKKKAIKGAMKSSGDAEKNEEENPDKKKSNI